LLNELELRLSRLESIVDKLDAKVGAAGPLPPSVPAPGVVQYRCYDCGHIFDHTPGFGLYCPNGHDASRMVPLASPEADEMLADLDAYNVRHAQAAARAQGR